jgi:hypothetical protein
LRRIEGVTSGKIKRRAKKYQTKQEKDEGLVSEKGTGKSS